MKRVRSCWAIVVAAGRGRRMGGELPKQFLLLDGRPLFVHALEALLAHEKVLGAVVALPRGFVGPGRKAIALARARGKPIRAIAGGRERADSVLRALAVLPDPVSHVMIHDGVRPLVDEGLIDRVMTALERHDAIVPALPSIDTLKQVTAHGTVVRTLDRRHVVAVQTPQAFDRTVLERAYRRAGRRASSFTDCSGLVARAGYPVRIVPGSRHNLKVTTPEDLLVIEALSCLRSGPAPARSPVRGGD